eukprot:TRINITY_DN4920_c0_g1_i5.p1 TRINITY_DN4920_c0_g1~~TRINITY_DN4920_c0_g1_i5.p1  ORF type:complete len:355 (+),score=22.57 TRINITY_DN4920_c0_g1_i5:53-1066(+)
MSNYVQTLHKYGNSQLEIVLELLKHKVCPRCCLRFSGVGPDKPIYLEVAPHPNELKHQILEKLAKIKNSNNDETPNQQEDMEQQICPLCLGVLQSLDGVTDHMQELKAFLPDKTKSWSYISAIQKKIIVKMVEERMEDFKYANIGIEVFGSIAFREKCMWKHILKQKQLDIKGLKYDQLSDVREVLKSIVGTWFQQGEKEDENKKGKADLQLIICVSHPGGFNELIPFIKLSRKSSVSGNPSVTGKRKGVDVNPHNHNTPLFADASWVGYNQIDNAMRDFEHKFKSQCYVFDAVPQTPNNPAKLAVKICTPGYHIGGRYLKLKKGKVRQKEGNKRKN